VLVGYPKTILLESGAFQLPSTQLHIFLTIDRTLADIDDRGKLNLEEFHVAMGLIYRSMYIFSYSDSKI
jgi:hypothetical protein